MAEPDAPAPRDEALVEAARERAGTPLAGRDRRTSALMGGAFLATAVAMAAFLPSDGLPPLLVVVALVGAYALVSRVEFEVGTGSAVPTQLVFVPMLFILPAALVPMFVAAGYLLGGVVDYSTRRIHVERAFVHLTNSWYAVGPALVLTLFSAHEPRWGDWPIYVGAVAAQFAFDLGSAATREWFAFRNSPRRLLPYFAWVYTIDALLAPIGLLAAFAAADAQFAFLLTLPLVCLLALLARERQTRIDRAVAFNQAYRGASEVARRDALTGLANRLAWEEALVEAEARRRESGITASVVVVDVDRLKTANDSRGHEFGDAVLREIAAVVRSNVRDRDVVARVGGDELAVLMVEMEEERSRETMRRLESALDRHRGLDGFPLSATFGFATCRPGEAIADAQRKADEEMYLRKPRSPARTAPASSGSRSSSSRHR